MLASDIEAAKTPKELFGELDGILNGDKLESLSKIYHAIMMKIHPDVNHDINATALATKVSNFFHQARIEVAQGRYGRNPQLKINIKDKEYNIEDMRYEGAICSLYRCFYKNTDEAILKLARIPVDNDLVTNEAAMLKSLEKGEEYDKFKAFFPTLLESFLYVDDAKVQRRANVLKNSHGFYSLEEVKKRYPDGIDPKDMAWMWRRTLIALGYSHDCGIVHGAVLPSHILIHPELHGYTLIDWCYSVKSGKSLTAIPSEYKDWYPGEVLEKKSVSPATDIYTAARSMVYLMGKEESIPKRLRAFFNGCMLSSQRQRPENAWALLLEFDELIEKMWGPRKYRPFSME